MTRFISPETSKVLTLRAGGGFSALLSQLLAPDFSSLIHERTPLL